MKKYFFVILIYLITSFNLYSQDVNKNLIDSLKIELEKTLDKKDKINILYRLGEEYSYSDLVKTEYYAKLLLSISIEDKEFAYCKGLHNNLIAVKKIYSVDIKSALQYLKESELLFKNSKFIDYYLDSLYLIVVCNFYDSNLDLALKFLDLGIKNALLHKKNKMLSSFYSKKAQYYEIKRDDLKALNYYLKSDFYLNQIGENRFKETDFYLRKIEIYCGISLAYLRTKNLNKAYEYAVLSVKSSNLNGLTNKYFVAKALTMMSRVEFALGNYDAALKSVVSSIERNKLINDKLGLAINLDLLCKIYVATNKYDELIKTSNDILKNYNNHHFSNDSYYYLAFAYHYKKNKKKSLMYRDILIKILEQEEKNIENRVRFYDWYKMISIISQNNHEFKLAYDYLEKYNEITLFISNKDNQLKIRELQSKFDINQKNLRIKELTIERQQNLLKLAKSEKNFIITLLVSVSLGFFLVILFYSVKAFRKINGQLEKKNLLLEEKKIELTNSVLSIELLIKEIHHRVKNNLQLMMSLMNIQSRETKNTETLLFLNKTQSRIASMLLIHEHLYQTDDFSKINFQLYLENLISYILNANSNEEKNITFIVNAKDVFFDIDQSIPLGLIINELIINSLKHSFLNKNNGNIKISLIKDGEKYFFTYEDDGFFDIEKYNLGSNNSIGLKLIELLTIQIKGKLEKPSSNFVNYKITFVKNK